MAHSGTVPLARFGLWRTKTVIKPMVIKAGLSLMHWSGMKSLLASATRGVGAIFMLHRVQPRNPPPFAPNSLLSVTPEFLADTIATVRDEGYDIVSIDEAAARLRADACDRRFVVFTLDDGYRDNLVHAYPVFKEHGVPFTIYVPSAYADGNGMLWWEALERVIAGNDAVALPGNGDREAHSASLADKKRTYEQLYWRARGMTPDAQRDWVCAFAELNGFDLETHCRAQIMDWVELKRLSADPLATIGAHTVNHAAVAKLEPDQAFQEMCQGADRIAAELGERPLHFSYPYGDPGSAGPRDFDLANRAGFETAVTTRKGLLFKDHGNHLTALPRVSLNGGYQDQRHVSLFLSGVPLAFLNSFRPLNVT